MKVKDLIEQLKKLDQELEVVTDDNEWGYFRAKKVEVTKVTIKHHFTDKPNETFKAVVIG